jgi:hypothetical protein
MAKTVMPMATQATNGYDGIFQAYPDVAHSPLCG